MCHLAKLRAWLGPLGRYRPWLFRQDLARGFRTCDAWYLPAWARWRGWSSPEERLLDSLDLAGKVVYDVGAHTGAYSLYFSRRVGPHGQVVAFEPQALSFSKLTRNLRGNAIANVRPICLALGAADGMRPIYMLPRMFTTASLAPEACTPLRRVAGLTRVERLDHVIAALALPRPDFIKIDVEGLELEVLAGAAATLSRYRPCVMLEVHGANRRQKAAQVGLMAGLLRPLGYALTHIESGRPLCPDEAGVAAGHILAQIPIRTRKASPVSPPAMLPAR